MCFIKIFCNISATNVFITAESNNSYSTPGLTDPVEVCEETNASNLMYSVASIHTSKYDKLATATENKGTEENSLNST